MIKGICLRGVFTNTSVLVLGLAFLRSNNVRQSSRIIYSLNVQYCHIIQVSARFQVDRSKSGCQ